MNHVLHLGNCLDPVTGLASLPDKSVDHVICDPPYSEGLYARMRTNRRGVRSDGRVERGDYGANAARMADRRIGAIDEILDDVAAHFLRLARRWVIVFHDVEIDQRWRDAFGNAYVRTGAWVKPDAMPQISGDRPSQGFEMATIAHQAGRKRWNGGGLPAVWVVPNATKGDWVRDHHPCPKPLPLMETLVEQFTDPGDLVCDPFAGSGTTGVACKRLGRRFVGWELDPKYHAIAVKRIDAAREQYRLPLSTEPEPKQIPFAAPSAATEGEG